MKGKIASELLGRWVCQRGGYLKYIKIEQLKHFFLHFFIFKHNHILASYTCVLQELTTYNLYAVFCLFHQSDYSSNH